MFRAVGRALRKGKSLTICQGDVFAEREDGSEPVQIAVMLATMSVKTSHHDAMHTAEKTKRRQSPL